MIGILKYLKLYQRWLLLAPLLIVIEVVMDLMLPKIMANIVNIGIGNSDLSYVLFNVGIMVSLTIIGVLGGLGSIYVASLVSESVSFDLRNDLFKKINKLSFLNFNKIKPGHFITVLTNDTNIIGMTIMIFLRFVIRVPIVIIGSIIMAITLSPKLSLIFFVFIPLVIISVIIIVKKVLPLFKIVQTIIDRINIAVRENISGVRVIKSFVKEEYEQEKFNEINLEMKNIMVRTLRFLALTVPLMLLFINLTIVFVLWFGSYLVSINDIEIGNVIAFVQYLNNILMNIVIVVEAVFLGSKGMVSATRIKDIFNLTDNEIEDSKTISKKRLNGKVEFKNVSFAYDKDKELVLKDINFSVNKGETVAILGSIGSGKTTIGLLLMRLYDPNKGSILIDGIDLKDYSIKTLRKNISMAHQKVILFSDTIENNIKYGNENLKHDEVVKISKMVQAHNFIMKYENGYNHLIEEGGVNLSGGQKQRLSLARALAINPSILILDDATSALDMETEQKIRQTINTKLTNKTIFIITARVVTALEADQIIVLDNGKIVGIGTHQELIETNKVYQNIYNLQLSQGEII